MDDFLSAELRCPYCGGLFKRSNGRQARAAEAYDVLACYCGRYPVVAGIPILKKGRISATGQTADEMVHLIEAGSQSVALQGMLMPAAPPSPAFAPIQLQSLPSIKGIRWLKSTAHRHALRRWQQQATAFLANLNERTTARDMLDFYFRRSRSPMAHAYDYFALRFGQPRHVVALSFADLIHQPSKPILELACGFGHITRSVIRQAGSQPVIGLDHTFFALYVAKNWIAPQAQYVCCEADAGLPFPADAFSNTLCVDGIHCFANKVTVIRELKRVTQNDGLMMLVASRNALVAHPYSGQPLPPQGYDALLSDTPHRLVSDHEVLARYFQKQGPPLARSSSAESLAQAPLLSILASQRQEVFQDHGAFEDWPHAHGRLQLNPLYVRDGQDRNGSIHLRRAFPSVFYEEENAECKQYLPEDVSVGSQVWLDLERGRRTPEMERLIERCVVLGMPERYG